MHSSVLSTREPALSSTKLPLPGRRAGKVRDLYELPPDLDGGRRLLVIATDRVSAFDVVLPEAAPGKGRLLTQISLWWFRRLRRLGIVPDHVIHSDVDAVPPLRPEDRPLLRDRIMVCRAAKVVPIECVARGFLAGSALAEYRRHGTACGVRLPAGLRPGDPLPEPIFTPATKAEEGHDENISFERACELVGAPLMTRLRDLTLAIYSAAAEYALERGVILADTKFEFGFALGADGKPTDELILVDEVLTPDSSRYWPASDYAPGRDQQSYDKQFVRNYLLKLVAEKQWNKEPPGPPLPADIVEATVRRYEEALAKLALPPFGAPRGGAR